MLLKKPQEAMSYKGGWGLVSPSLTGHLGEDIEGEQAILLHKIWLSKARDVFLS